VDIEKLQQRAPKADRYSSTRSLESEVDVPADAVLSGSAGRVFTGTRREGGRSCVVKTFHKDACDARGLVEIKLEVEIYMTLDHPRIARLEDIFETETKLHLVMEHLAGGDLFSRYYRQRVHESRTVAVWMTQLFQGLAYMHGRKIVHRDVKLENLVFEAPGSDNLKLVDFGCAVHWNGTSPLTRPCGTPGYAALEIYTHKYTDKVDVWSAGVVAFILLTGSFPLPNAVIEAKQMAQKSTMFENPAFRALASDVQDFVRCLLAYRPKSRPSVAQALSHRWLVPETLAHMDSITMLSLRRAATKAREERWRLNGLAWVVPLHETQEPRAQFLATCDKTGIITRMSFVTTLVQNLQWERADASLLFEALDDDGTGEISWTQFLAATLCRASSKNDLSEHDIFAEAPRDGRALQTRTADEAREMKRRELSAWEDRGFRRRTRLTHCFRSRWCVVQRRS